MAFTDFISSLSKEVGEILIKFTGSVSFAVIINTDEYFSVVQKEMRRGPEDENNKDKMKSRSTKYKAMHY